MKVTLRFRVNYAKMYNIQLEPEGEKRDFKLISISFYCYYVFVCLNSYDCVCVCVCESAVILFVSLSEYVCVNVYVRGCVYA